MYHGSFFKGSRELCAVNERRSRDALVCGLFFLCFFFASVYISVG